MEQTTEKKLLVLTLEDAATVRDYLNRCLQFSEDQAEADLAVVAIAAFGRGEEAIDGPE